MLATLEKSAFSDAAVVWGAMSDFETDALGVVDIDPTTIDPATESAAERQLRFER
ncbi:MAG: hypothetical protein JWP24_2617, partial [Marmoricola sp.]|nr:hypothetical protein [Marmoricola sp.]